MDIEFIKLLSSFVTPVVILVLGIWAKGIATEHARRISLNDRIIEKRVQIYEAIGKDLNDIYAFLFQVGQWKELSPLDIVKKKRNIDKIMYINRPYWSDVAFDTYCAFMASAFETWTGVGEDAKIRTYTEQFKELDQWGDDWAAYFSAKDPDIIGIKQTYKKLMSIFSEQFGFIQD
jgi:hypothetical protein